MEGSEFNLINHNVLCHLTCDPLKPNTNKHVLRNLVRVFFYIFYIQPLNHCSKAITESSTTVSLIVYLNRKLTGAPWWEWALSVMLKSSCI